MTLHISRDASHATVPTGLQAGCVMVASFKHVFSTAFTAATDILELGVIPAHAKLIRATLIGTGLATLTADVGVMDGDALEEDDTRALTGTLIANDADIAGAVAEVGPGALAAFTKANADRGLGVTLSGDVSAGTDSIEVIIEYTY
jgi:hypothetical protein